MELLSIDAHCLFVVSIHGTHSHWISLSRNVVAVVKIPRRSNHVHIHPSALHSTDMHSTDVLPPLVDASTDQTPSPKPVSSSHSPTDLGPRFLQTGQVRPAGSFAMRTTLGFIRSQLQCTRVSQRSIQTGSFTLAATSAPSGQLRYVPNSKTTVRTVPTALPTGLGELTCKDKARNIVKHFLNEQI